MIKNFLIAFLISSMAFAGLPPTTSKVSSDSVDVTTFKYRFPNFTGTHTGTIVSLGVNSTAGGGTGLSSFTAGDLMYFASGTAFTKLGIGASTTILTSSGSAPQWSTVSTVAGSLTHSSLGGLTTGDAGHTQFALLAGRSGGQTLYGGTASSDGLNLGANDEAYSDTNTGEIMIKDRILFDDAWTVAGSSMVDSWIRFQPTITTGVAVNAMAGFTYSPTFRYSVAQVASSAAAFIAQPTFQPTSGVTDAATLFAGFLAQPTYSPDNAGTNTSPIFMGYDSQPFVGRTNASATVNVTTVAPFSTYGSLFFSTALQNATVTNLIHFNPGMPSTSSLTLTNHTIYKIPDITSGTNRIGIESLLNSSANYYFIKSTGTAASYIRGTMYLGNTAAAQATAQLEVDGALAVRSSGSVTNLTADNSTVTVGNRTYIRLSSNSGTATARTFILSAGTVEGQLVLLEWTGTNAAELVDDSAAGSGNHRMAGTWTPTQYDTISFIWNGTDWIETARATN